MRDAFQEQFNTKLQILESANVVDGRNRKINYEVADGASEKKFKNLVRNINETVVCLIVKKRGS